MDAFDCATEVPLDIKRITSGDEYRRDRAIEKLHDSICHQGSIYSATEAALPFLMTILVNTALPDRNKVAGLVQEIGHSAAMSEENVRKLWEMRHKLAGGKFQHLLGMTLDQKVRYEVALNKRILQCLAVYRSELDGIVDDPSLEVSRETRALRDWLRSRD